MRRALFLALPAALALPACAADLDDSRARIARAGQDPAVFIVGEVHGTKEVPEYFFELAEYMSSRHRGLAVGLEMPAEAVRSGCTPAAAGSSFWTHGRDGRSSEAMRSILCRLQALERAGRIRLFGFAGGPRAPAGDPYTQPVADALSGSGRALVLVGNVHARRAPGSLAQDLTDRGISVLSMTMSGTGSAWACKREGCAAAPWSVDFCGVADNGPTFHTDRWTSPASSRLWDACLAFPSLTASPPHRP